MRVCDATFLCADGVRSAARMPSPDSQITGVRAPAYLTGSATGVWLGGVGALGARLADFHTFEDLEIFLLEDFHTLDPSSVRDPRILACGPRSKRKP